MTVPFNVKTWAEADEGGAAQTDMSGVVVDILVHHNLIQAIVVLDNGKVVTRKLNELRGADHEEIS